MVGWLVGQESDRGTGIGSDNDLASSIDGALDSPLLDYSPINYVLSPTNDFVSPTKSISATSQSLNLSKLVSRQMVSVCLFVSWSDHLCLADR